jgi:cytochrome c biogenesis protein CcmG/thiol:disulfide interchange protein DsbE
MNSHPPSLQGEPRRRRRVALALQTLLIVAVCATLAVIVAGVLQPRPRLAPLPTGARPAAGSPAVGIAVGDAAPNFTLRSASGVLLSLSDVRGRPVVLNFWYRDCPGCLAEAPALERFYRQGQASDTAHAPLVLGINVFDNASSVRAFAAQEGLTYPLLLDGTRQVMNLYNVNAFPTSYFLNAQGIIRAYVVGPLDEQTLAREAALIA